MVELSSFRSVCRPADKIFLNSSVFSEAQYLLANICFWSSIYHSSQLHRR